MKDLIESGEFFKQGREWYNQIFLSPRFLRSAVFTFAITGIIFLVVLYFNIKMLFPVNRQIIYAINVSDASNFAARILNANHYENNTEKSVTRIFLETYVRIRERYNYEDLADQMLFVRNTSTRAIFNRYSSYLSLDNPESPVLRLQRYAKKEIVVNKIDIKNDDSAVVEFTATSFEESGNMIEKVKWTAKIEYVIDLINIDQAAGTPFKFTVRDYSLKKIGNL